MKRFILCIAVSFGVCFSGFADDVVSKIENEIDASIISTTPSVKLMNGHVVLSSHDDSPVTFHIYSIIGQLIKSVTVTAGNSTATVELPKGYYIVKCEKWTKQVIVK